ncbi:hypothetical protein [Actinoplanes sp. NPDC051859]|uniref:hypothetical protein n=1 Tax=Actinoplanes sp. NPDC051859 TaxID=3363909 RepID=UPI0037A5D691
MRGLTWVRLIFLGAVGLQVATVFLDERLVPYCGTVAMVALLAMSMASPPPLTVRWWTPPVALTGLILLTVAAFLADHRTGGFGWTTDVADGDGDSLRFGLPGSDSHVVEAVFLVVGAAALAAAVLGRVGRLLRRQHLPGALIGVIFVAAAAVMVVKPLFADDMVSPHPLLRALVIMPAGYVVAVSCLAANAALVSRAIPRQAAAGMLAVAALAMLGLTSLEEMDSLQPRFDRSAAAALEADAKRFVAGEPAERVFDIPPYLQKALWASEQPGLNAEESLTEFYRHLPPPSTPEEAYRRAVRIDKRRESGMVAVPHAPTWGNGDADWTRSRPALKATLIAVGLVALVSALFPASGAGPFRRYVTRPDRPEPHGGRDPRPPRTA